MSTLSRATALINKYGQGASAGTVMVQLRHTDRATGAVTLSSVVAIPQAVDQNTKRDLSLRGYQQVGASGYVRFVFNGTVEVVEGDLIGYEHHVYAVVEAESARVKGEVLCWKAMAVRSEFVGDFWEEA